MSHIDAFAAITRANTGHGHVRPRPDGVVARCGGPGLCAECNREAAAHARGFAVGMATTRIEFAPGHEEAHVEQDVAAQMRLMKLAPRMLSAIRRARQKLVTYTSIYDGDKELRSLLREWDEILAAAEGRSHKESA